MWALSKSTLPLASRNQIEEPDATVGVPWPCVTETFGMPRTMVPLAPVPLSHAALEMPP